MRPVDDIRRVSPRAVLIIQGSIDNVIPPDSAQRLYNAAGEPRMIWIADNAGHVATFEMWPAEYTQHVIEFFDTMLLASDTQHQ